jgi:putative ABC transport system permease protein
MFPQNINSMILSFESDPKKGFDAVIRRAIYEVDPRLITVDVGSINLGIDDSLGAEEYAFRILKGLSVVAFILTLIGLFAVIAYTVDSRMAEFGVRMAIGATPCSIHRLVLSKGMTAAGIGLVLGTLAACGLTRFMRSLLFETTPFDPLVYAGVAAVLVVGGGLACWIPARRAARLDVVKLLKWE